VARDGARLAPPEPTKFEPSELVLKTKITGAGLRVSLSSLPDHGKGAVTMRADDVRGLVPRLSGRRRPDLLRQGPEVSIG